ncbi:hypothetical protein DIPPA_55314 [Diplonema papillatum]|nr:hypothetical protein DIPPA_55314 [Diplonema papillatum]
MKNMNVSDPTPPGSVGGDLPDDREQTTSQRDLSTAHDVDDPPYRRPTPPPGLMDENVDWQARCQDSERECHVLAARCEALNRLLQSSGSTTDAKVRYLSEELSKRNVRIKELEKQVEHHCNEYAKLSSTAAARSKTSRDSRSLSQVKELSKRLTLKNETLASLQNQLQEMKRNSQADPALFRSSSRQLTWNDTPSYDRREALLHHARECIDQLQRQLADKTSECSALQIKLSDAQQAIMTNVDGIADLDSKLQQSRKALRWLLRAQSVSPRSASPVNPWPSQPPQYSGVYPGIPQMRSGSPNGYSSLPAAPLGRSTSATLPSMGHLPTRGRPMLDPEQLQALRDLESLLAAREVSQTY